MYELLLLEIKRLGIEYNNGTKQWGRGAIMLRNIIRLALEGENENIEKYRSMISLNELAKTLQGLLGDDRDLFAEALAGTLSVNQCVELVPYLASAEIMRAQTSSGNEGFLRGTTLLSKILKFFFNTDEAINYHINYISPFNDKFFSAINAFIKKSRIAINKTVNVSELVLPPETILSLKSIISEFVESLLVNARHVPKSIGNILHKVRDLKIGKPEEPVVQAVVEAGAYKVINDSLDRRSSSGILNVLTREKVLGAIVFLRWISVEISEVGAIFSQDNVGLIHSNYFVRVFAGVIQGLANGKLNKKYLSIEFTEAEQMLLQEKVNSFLLKVSHYKIEKELSYDQPLCAKADQREPTAENLDVIYEATAAFCNAYRDTNKSSPYSLQPMR